MRRLFFDMLEINIAVSVIILILCLFAGRLRKKYGAEWMKLVWLILAVRLLIPYNFSLPFAEIKLLNYPGFAQEESVVGNVARTGSDSGENTVWTNGEIDESMLKNMGDGELQNDAGNIGQSNAQSDMSQNNIMTNLGDTEKYIGNTENEKNGENDGINEINANNINGEHSLENKENAALIAGEGSTIYTVALVRIWLCGMILYCICHVINYFLFYRKLRRSLRPIADKTLMKQLIMLQKKLIGKNSILVYQSKIVASPMLIGVLHPKLVFPAGRRHWEMTELELIMAHELCHYKKKDIWSKLLMTAVCCVNWFDPAVHLMKKQFFYDMELACDGSVLLDRSEEEREIYARVMLFFVGNARKSFLFSTGFQESKKRMKDRIDYMLDAETKKKGVFSIIVTGCLIVGMCLIVSCGYKPEETGSEEKLDQAKDQVQDDDLPDEIVQDDSMQDNSEAESMAEEENSIFDYNHDYNKMICCYGNDTYIARSDGIYRLQDGAAEEELIYENSYRLLRGLEFYNDYLYFCGSVKVGEQDAATIYRMNLDTLVVEDILTGMFRETFYDLYHISIYEDKLYAATGYGRRIGFEIDENGEIVGALDETADDFLYKEYNDYMELELQKINAEYGSEEYWDLAEESAEKYLAVTDVASCIKMLNGKQVVSKYKDELYRSLYLEDEDGTYEYLCDMVGFVLVTETGVYYSAKEREGIWFIDYENKLPVKIYEQEGLEFSEILLANYDETYLYFLESRHLGHDMEENTVYENYLLRVPRQGGKAEKVSYFGEYKGLGSLLLRCGVDSEHMYFAEYETRSLDPDANGMQRENSGEPSEDAAEMTQIVEDFAGAYFQNDSETMYSYLTENFDGTLEPYADSQNVGQMEKVYIGGLPSRNVDIGISCYVYSAFTPKTESDEAAFYFNMTMLKTEQGWKITQCEVQEPDF